MTEQSKLLAKLKECSLFSHASKLSLRKLAQHAIEKHFHAGENILLESEEPDFFYIILQGEVRITRKLPIKDQPVELALLKSGDSIGDITVIDSGTRSASAEAVTDCYVLAISIDNLQNILHGDQSFWESVLRMSKNLTQLLREANNRLVAIASEKIAEQAIRISMGYFTIVTITAICIYTIVLNHIQPLSVLLGSQTFVTAILTLIYLAMAVFLFYQSHLPIWRFGMTWRNSRKAIVESILWSLLVMALLMIIRWFAIHYLPKYQGRPFFDLYASINIQPAHHESRDFSKWLLTLFIYISIVAPLQEIITRGCLQSLLALFLKGKHRIMLSILISNLMFSTTHLGLSAVAFVGSFLLGISWGILYARHRTLVGVMLSHILIGAWGIWLLGFNL